MAYLVEGTKNGKEMTYEFDIATKEACLEECEKEGIKVAKIESTKTHHVCKYCYCIASGTDEDLLCDECRQLFGHTFYSEL